MGYVVSGVSAFGSRFRADFRWQNDDGSLDKRIRRMLASTDYDDAQREALWMAEHRLTRASDGSISLERAMELYVQSRKGEVSPLTVREYECSLRKIQRSSSRLASSPIKSLDAEKIRKYESMRLRNGVSPNSVRKEHFLISAALDMAVAGGGIAGNPAKGLKPPRKSLRAPQPFDAESSLVPVISRMQGRVGLSANIAIDARATACQVAPLEWCDFDSGLSEGRLTKRVSPEYGRVTAYQRPRCFSLSSVTRKKLEIARSFAQCPEGPLFDAAPITISREFNRVARVFGLECIFSDLRKMNRA